MNTTGTTSLGTLVVYLTANASQYDRALKAVEASTAASMEVVIKTVKYAAVAIVATLAIIGAAGAREFAKLDSEVTKGLAIFGDSSIQTRKLLEDNARRIAVTSSNSADQVASAYSGLASAGLSVQQAVKALGVVEKFSIAGQIDMNRSVLMLTDSVGALGLATSDAAQYQVNIQRVADVLAAGANISQASVEELAQALQGKVAGSLRLVNKTVEEGVAVLGAFAKAGIKGSDASDKFNQVIRDLQVSALEQPQIWKEFGLSVYDASGNMRNFADIVADMEKALGPLSAEQKRVTLTMLGFQDRSVSAMQSILGFSGLIREYEGALKKAGGTTKDMADIQLSSLVSQFTILLNNIKEMLLVVGENLVPILSTLNSYFRDGAKDSGSFAASARDVSDIINTALLTSINVIQDVVAGWKLIIKGGSVAVAAVTEAVTRIIAGAVEGVQVQVKLAVDALNLLIRASNATYGKLNDSLKMKEIDFQGFAILKTLKNTADGASDAVDKLVKEFFDLAEKGRPSEKFITRLNVETQKLAGYGTGAATALQAMNLKLPPLNLNLSHTATALATITPELLQFREMTRDPLGGAMIESFKVFDKVMAQGLMTAEQYAAAVRDVVSKQNQFVMPVKGMQTQTGDPNIDAGVDLNNEEKLLTDSYNRKLKAVQDYYTSLGALTSTQEKTRLELLNEMEQIYLAQTQTFANKRQELMMTQAMQISDSLLSITKDMAGEQSGIYKAMFAVSKAFAIADAIVKIQQAMASAAMSLPFPANLGAMASVAAATAGIISAITSTVLSFEGGGDTGGGPRSGGLDGKGGFMAMLHPQEKVFDLTRGGGQRDSGAAVSVQLNQNFYGGVTRADLDQSAAKTKREAMLGMQEGIKRGGAVRRAVRR